MLRRPVLLVMLLACGLLSACLGGSDPSGSIGRYVALGDSSASGPGIESQDSLEPTCQRSDRNYPSVLAKTLEVETFVDVTCTGETTAMMRDGRPGSDGEIDPQLDAVDDATDLVTISIGNNDGSASLALIAGCLVQSSASDPVCDDFVTNVLPSVITTTATSVASTVEQVKKLAPKAQVVLVGYLTTVPTDTSCDALPLSDVERAGAVQYESSIDDMLKKVAAQVDVPFVDVRASSTGHDACADDAWVNGLQDVPGDGVLLHPNAEGMRHVAQEVAKVVRR